MSEANDVRRYDLEPCDGDSGRCFATLYESPMGDYVLFEDYDRDLAEMRRQTGDALTRVAELEGLIRTTLKMHDDCLCRDRLEAFRAALNPKDHHDD